MLWKILTKSWDCRRPPLVGTKSQLKLLKKCVGIFSSMNAVCVLIGRERSHHLMKPIETENFYSPLNTLHTKHKIPFLYDSHNLLMKYLPSKKQNTIILRTKCSRFQAKVVAKNLFIRRNSPKEDF